MQQETIMEGNPGADSWVREFFLAGQCRLENFVPVPRARVGWRVDADTKRVFITHQGRPCMAAGNELTVWPRHNWHLIALGGSIKASRPHSLAERIMRRLFAVPKGERL